MCWVAGASRVVQCLPGCRGQSGRCTAAAGLACASPFCAHAAKCQRPSGPLVARSKACRHGLQPGTGARPLLPPCTLTAPSVPAVRQSKHRSEACLQSCPQLSSAPSAPPPRPLPSTAPVGARQARQASRAPPKLKGAWSACSCASTRESPGAPLAAAAVTATFHRLQLRCPTSAAAPLQAWRFPQPHTPMKQVAVTA